MINKSQISRILFLFLTAVFICEMCSCGYLHMMIDRKQLKKNLSENPSQSVRRELDNESNRIIYGRILSMIPVKRPIAVAAISYKFGRQDLVASSFLSGTGFYSLVVPPGQYQIYVLLDTNQDSIFTSSECVGYYQDPTNRNPFISIDAAQNQDFIIHGSDIYIVSSVPFTIDQPVSIRLPYTCCKERKTVDYPPEVIRSLDDTLFSREMSEIGIYNPAQFSSMSGLYYYALEDWNMRKTPVLFVHGYGGTPREFSFLAAHLDTSRYQPVFFHYPTGQSLERSSRILYEVFFSGKAVYLHNKPFLVVAHSIGGLVARAAINLYCERHKPGKPVRLISLCTPYGGVDAAAKSLQRAPEVIDSWRDIASSSDFLRKLHKSDLPENVNFYLFFGYKDPGRIKMNENSDGTIELWSQLFDAAQRRAENVSGFNESHESILLSPEVAKSINSILRQHF